MTGIEGLLAGRVLADRYHVEKVIGRGGMGAVYQATDQRLGRPVAVKVIMVPSADPETRERLRQRFLREAQTAARLRHRNVVTVHDFGTDAALGLDYLVMELMEGEDVATRVGRAGPLSPAAAVELLSQAASGLAAGHRVGLVHRDVKPGNLFLEEDEHGGGTVVRVLDFGIVQVALESDTLTHLTVAGRGPLSPAYASPEQLRGETRITPASDVFSLAAVGLYALTGEKPFAAAPGETRGEAEAARAASERLEAIPGLPEGLLPVLRRALEPDPARRFPDANALREALEAVRRGSGEDATRLAAATFAPVAAAPVADLASPLAGDDDDATRLSSGPAPAGAPVPDDEDDRTRVAGPPPPPVVVPPPPRDDFPAAPTTGPVRARRGGRSWVVPAAVAVALGGAAVAVLNRPDGGPAPAAPVDSAAIRDSLARDSARIDSARVAGALRDSLERERTEREQALRDSLTALARADSARRAGELAGVRIDSARAEPPPPAPPGGGDRVYSLAEVEVGPELLNRGQVTRQLARRYPPGLRQAGVSGQVLLGFVIDEQGRVVRGSVTVLSSSNESFNAPSIAVVEEMRFAPARLGGRPVRVRADLPVSWDGR